MIFNSFTVQTVHIHKYLYILLTLRCLTSCCKKWCLKDRLQLPLMVRNDVNFIYVIFSFIVMSRWKKVFSTLCSTTLRRSISCSLTAEKTFQNLQNEWDNESRIVYDLMKAKKLKRVIGLSDVKNNEYRISPNRRKVVICLTWGYDVVIVSVFWGWRQSTSITGCVRLSVGRSVSWQRLLLVLVADWHQKV